MSLSDELIRHLQGEPLAQISQQLGVPQAQVANAAQAALPLLLGALGRNASQANGAEALFGALQKDHAGVALGSVLGAVLGGGGQGDQILAHVFGGRQSRAEDALGTATGLGGDRAGQLLRMLAPLVLAYLARRLFSQQGAASPAMLGDVLGKEHQRVIEDREGSGGLLGAVLDQDGDGQLGLDDLLKIGGGLFGGKR
ncbi:MAG TPA: DUF937 domain-containing protein [Lysobacter sp.]|jgi:hypothetical protein|nr:DUF937 domain-containing protein [Lysobacter sp.]